RADGAARGGRRRPRSPAWQASGRGRGRGANRYRVPRVLWEGRRSSAGVRSKARALDLTTRSTAQAVARWTYPYRVLLRMPPIATYSALIAAILSRVISPCAERTSSLYRRAELPPKIAVLTIPSAGPSGAKQIGRASCRERGGGGGGGGGGEEKGEEGRRRGVE